MGRKAVDSNSVFYDGMPVPQEDLIGEEGKGFHYILHGLNPEDSDSCRGYRNWKSRSKSSSKIWENGRYLVDQW